MSALEANLDLVLIENKQLQDSNRPISKQLASVNLKYNQLLQTLQTQYSFMHDVELRMNLIMKRDKPLKQDLARIREQRNYLKEDNRALHHQNIALKDEKDRLAKENVWLLEQIEQSRKMNNDMMSLYKANEGSSRDVKNDIGERAHALELEKTRLEVEKQTHMAKIQRYEQDLKRSLIVIDDLRRHVLNEQSRSEALKVENNEMKRQLMQTYATRSSENEKNALQLKFLQEQIKNLELDRAKTTNAPAPAPKKEEMYNAPSSNQVSHQQVTFKLQPEEPTPVLGNSLNTNTGRQSQYTTRDEQETKNTKTFNLQPPASASKSDFLQTEAKRMIDAKRKSPIRRSPSPANPFFPSSRNSGLRDKGIVINEENSELQRSSLGTDKDRNDPSLGSPDKSTFMEQPTFLVQEAIASRQVMENLDKKIKNLECF